MLGSAGSFVSDITDMPQFVTYAVNTGLYGLGTIGALFGAAAVNNGTARQAALMPGGYNPTSRKLEEREVGETISTVIATAAVPASVYYFDIANRILAPALN